MGELEPYRIVRLEDDAVVVLDQRRLPGEEVELRCGSAAEVAEAIRTLAVRGAPAIGVAAAYGLALAAARGEDVDAAYEELAGSRPTAINLRWALDEMRPDPTAERARAIHEDGGRALPAHERPRRWSCFPRTPVSSRIATPAVWRRVATAPPSAPCGLRGSRAASAHVWVDETRPLLQGARLTAWELEQLGIPHAVIVDGAAGSLMARDEVDLVVTGADRIAANGDTANKIGTYGLAVLARHHGIPLVVVAPTSTLDPASPSGEAIPIEERAADEVSTRFPARNPAFDVTPAALIERDRHRARRASALRTPTPCRDRDTARRHRPRQSRPSGALRLRRGAIHGARVARCRR